MITLNSMRCLIKHNRYLRNVAQRVVFAAVETRCALLTHLSLHLSLNLRT